LEDFVRKSLDGVHVFHRLSDPRRRSIERACTWRRIEPGAAILSAADDSRDVFFLTEGRARSIIYAASGTVVGFGDLVAGTMFGEIAAIDGHPRAVGVEAVSDCTVASLSKSAFLALVRSEPDFALTLLEQVARNIRMLTARVFEFSTLPVNNRIHAELLRLAHASHDKAAPAGAPITLAVAPTHADLAARISTHREAVTRELNRLTKLGIIEKSSGMLTIKDVSRLKAMVQEAAGQ
jgi:CRP/FNR family transcriptional regulator, cyclic AMP receptor protein